MALSRLLPFVLQTPSSCLGLPSLLALFCQPKGFSGSLPSCSSFSYPSYILTWERSQAVHWGTHQTHFHVFPSLRGNYLSLPVVLVMKIILFFPCWPKVDMTHFILHIWNHLPSLTSITCHHCFHGTGLGAFLLTSIITCICNKLVFILFLLLRFYFLEFRECLWISNT